MGNKICHIEFSCKDTKQTAEWFSKLFGWTTDHIMDDYTLFLTEEGGLGGGFRAFEEGEAPDSAVRVYIEVDDIEGKLSEIEAAGGNTVMGKTPISPDHGFFAHFNDPDGVGYALWSRT